MHTSTNAHRAYLYHPDAEAVCDARGNSALENKMTFLIPRRVHRTPPVQSRSIGRHGSIHVYPGDDCACDFIDDEPTRRDAMTKRRADDLAVDTRDCDWLSKRDAMR
jgi:hypothetical protein